MGKRGQVTLFIVLALVIVGAVLMYFLWLEPNYVSEEGSRMGFEGCIQDALEEKIEELGLTGGIEDPQFFYMNQGLYYPYYCYTNEYYDLCTVQIPFPQNNFERELESAMKESIESCYDSSLDELDAQGYNVVSGDVNYNISLEPGFARVQISAPTTVGSQSFEEFDVRLNSAIYDMLIIATSILQYESTVGDTDLSAMGIYYSDYKATKDKMGDGTTLYEIESKVYGNKLQFASRSLVYPSGYN